MSRPKSPEDALASAHRANVQRYKVVPHRLIWLSGVVSGGTTTASAYAIFTGWSGGYSIDSFVLAAILPIALGYLSTVTLGIWADVRFADTQYALAIPLFFWLALAYAVFGAGTATGLLFCFSPFVIALGILGSRLGIYANRVRWDRKVSGGLLPVVFGE